MLWLFKRDGRKIPSENQNLGLGMHVALHTRSYFVKFVVGH